MWGQPPPAVRGVTLRLCVLFLKQILKCSPRVVRLQTSRCRRFLLTRHANLVQRAIIARIFFRDPLFNGLHALEAAAGIEIGALLARVQLETAFGTLALARTRPSLQDRSALRTTRDRARPRQIHRPRTQCVVPTRRTALALRWRLSRRLLTTRFSIIVLISGLTVFCQKKPPPSMWPYCPPDRTRAASLRIVTRGRRLAIELQQQSLATDQTDFHGSNSKSLCFLSSVEIRANPWQGFSLTTRNSLQYSDDPRNSPGRPAAMQLLDHWRRDYARSHSDRSGR